MYARMRAYGCAYARPVLDGAGPNFRLLGSPRLWSAPHASCSRTSRASTSRCIAAVICAVLPLTA
jgi:hypothetical protein